MLLALETAITTLLQNSFPALFGGAGAVQIGFDNISWQLDPSSLDPVAGEPGPLDAQDALAFDPANANGPFTLTRKPYPGPKRVYLRSPVGELVALSPTELSWDPADAAKFTFQPRPGRVLTGFTQLQVLYGIVAAGTQLKVQYQAALTLTGSSAAQAEQALSLSLAALALNRDALRNGAAYQFSSGSYQAAGTLKMLGFSRGATTGNSHSILLAAELNLLVQRLLGDDEGKPITQVLTPGRPDLAGGGRRVDIDPAVQA
jgi:hypothetical protein